MIEKNKVKVIDKEYFIVPFPARKGLNYLNKLKSIVGPALAKAFEGDAEDDELNTGSFSEAVELLIKGMDDNDFEKFVVEIIENHVSNAETNESIKFDLEFINRYDLVFGLMKEILKLNYGSLFLGDGDSDSPLKSLLPALAQ
jgi:hypothetical protein